MNVIYKIRNTVNGKFYVGSTNSLVERTNVHKNRLRRNEHHSAHLQAAWNKYGEAAFAFEVVEELPDDVRLFEAEQRWLDEHYGQPYCYNASKYADAPMRGRTGEASPAFGRVLPEESRQQISDALKEGYASGKYPHPRLGKTHTPEARQKMSEKLKGLFAGEKHYRWGKKLSEEVRKKIGDAQRGKPRGPKVLTPEGRAKIKTAAELGHYSHWKGKKHTEEAKAKLRKPIKELTSGQVFPSLTDTLKHYNMTMPTLTRALKSGQPIGPKSRYAGLVFVYTDVL